MTFIVVLVGWIFSLTLHEFSHALVAYYGGDYTVREKGYLTNPLKYIHPVTSILLPADSRLACFGASQPPPEDGVAACGTATSLRLSDDDLHIVTDILA